jgi:hypothetical protein
LREFERITAEVCKLNYFIALIMMSKNDEAAAQLFASGSDAIIDFCVLQARYALRQCCL